MRSIKTEMGGDIANEEGHGLLFCHNDQRILKLRKNSI